MIVGAINVLSNSTTNAPTLSPTPSSSNTIKFETIVSPISIVSGYQIPKNWFIELTVKQSRVNVGPFSFNSRLFCYRGLCMYPGPTIRVRPGDNVTITLTNDLDSDRPLQHSYSLLDAHGANTTNLYFHGLRLSPDSLNNDYFRQIPPGETGTIVVSVQPHHAPGIHWYRSQNHGFNTLHTMNGLVGAVIVEAETTLKIMNYPTSLKNADMILLVITKIVLGHETANGEVTQSCGLDRLCNSITQTPLCDGSEASSPFNPFRLDSLQELTSSASSGAGSFSLNLRYNSSYKGPPLPSSSSSYHSVDLVNGKYQPKVTISQTSPSIMRLIHASGGPPLRLSLTEQAACVCMSSLGMEYIFDRGN